MSGKQRMAKPTEAEEQMLALGSEQIATGRAIERPNLLYLLDKAPVSSSDRANTAAAAKAQAAVAGNEATLSSIAGLRRGGLTSGAGRVGLDQVAAAAGSAMSAGVNNTAANMDNIDLDSRTKLVQAGLGVAGDSMQSLSTGTAGLASAELSRVRNRNLKSETDANNFTKLATLGFMGANTLGSHFGAEDAGKGELRSANSLAGKFRDLGFRDAAYEASMSENFMKGMKQPGLLGRYSPFVRNSDFASWKTMRGE